MGKTNMGKNLIYKRKGEGHLNARHKELDEEGYPTTDGWLGLSPGSGTRRTIPIGINTDFSTHPA